MNKEVTDRKFANTLARGLSVLQCFTPVDAGLTHAQISERTNLPKPTVSRLTYTLCELGFLCQNGRHGRFYPGPAALAAGAVARISLPFLDMISGDMQRLADATQTLSVISVRDGDMMVLLRTWQPASGHTLGVTAGHRIPVLGSSSGQAVVAATDDARFERTAPCDKMRLFRENGHVQLLRQGFAIVPWGMRYAGRVNAVSVPYFAGTLGMPVAFSCGGMAGALSDALLFEEVGPALREVICSLERRTGQAPALVCRG